MKKICDNSDNNKNNLKKIIVNLVASKLYGVDATIIIFVFVLYCIVNNIMIMKKYVIIIIRKTKIMIMMKRHIIVMITRKIKSKQ